MTEERQLVVVLAAAVAGVVLASALYVVLKPEPSWPVLIVAPLTAWVAARLVNRR